MAAFFDRVPLEVREKVYQGLLVNEDGAIELHWSGRDFKGKLHPAILRTCKQAYTEASPVLYEQNHFRHKSQSDMGTSLRSSDRLASNFGRIKHLEIFHHGDIPDNPYSGNGCGNPVMAAMRYVAASECTLKTLYLGFGRFEHRGGYLYKNDDSNIAYDENLQKIIADLKVEFMIEVLAASSAEGYCRNFEYFVHNIGFLKQWAIVQEPQRKIENQLGEPAFYWTWILKPAITATQDKVPKSLKGDEED